MPASPNYYEEKYKQFKKLKWGYFDFFNQVIKTFMTCGNTEEEHWGRRGVGGKSQMGRCQLERAGKGPANSKHSWREKGRETQSTLWEVAP